jgi:SPP1 gp7 family putative phage head morphogenesis protein
MEQSAIKKVNFSSPLGKRKRKNPISLETYRLLDVTLTKAIAKLAHSEIVNRYKTVLTSTWNKESRAALIRAINEVGSLGGAVTQAELTLIDRNLEAALGSRIADLESAKIVQVDRGNWLNTRGAVEAELGVTLGWLLRDQASLDILAQNSFFWIGNHYERFVQDRIQGRLREYFEGGLNRNDLMLRMRHDFEREFARSDSYWDLLADHTATKVREMSRLSHYEQAGVEVIRVRAQLDDKTTEICRSLHGQVIDVKDLRRQMDKQLRAAQSRSPEKVKDAWPWWSDKQTNQRLNSQADVAANIKRSNIGMPPYHARCRTRTVAEFKAASGERVLSDQDVASGARVLDGGKTKAGKPKAPKEQKSKIPKTLRGVTTIAQAERYAAARHPKTAFEFTGGHIDTIKPSLRQFDKLAKAYPEMAERVAYFGTSTGPTAKARKLFNWEGGNKGTYAIAQQARARTVARRAILINPAYFGNPKLLKDRLKNMVKSGHTFPGGDSIESLISHEFGHFVEGSFAATKELGFMKTFYRKWGLPDNLSLYARTSLEEGFAEGFAASIHGTASVKANPYVVAQKQFIKQTREELT